MSLLAFSLAAAGPIVAPSEEAVRGGMHAGLVFALILGLGGTPVFLLLLLANLRRLRRARADADDHRSSP